MMATEARSLYLYSVQNEDKKTLILKVVNGNKYIQNIDILDEVDAIDRHSIEYIMTILGDDGAISSINSQIYELMHFIAAKRQYSDNPVIYKRVEFAFNNIITNYQLKQYYSTFRILELDKEKNYLQSLIEEDQEFSDLRENIEPIESQIQQAKLRKLYLLFLSNTLNCKIGNESEKAANSKFQTELREKLLTNFAIFKQSMLDLAKEKKLMKNPTYLVDKAWRYLQIHYKKRENGEIASK